MPNLYLAVHFETCGMPDTHSPIVLDAILFDDNGGLVDRFYCVVKPYEYTPWDSNADSTNLLTRELVYSIGVDYKTTSIMFKQFMNKYKDKNVTLICWDFTTLSINATYFTPNGTQNFLGCEKLPMRNLIDMKQVFKFYLLHLGEELKYIASMPQILKKWGIIQDSTYWSTTEFNGVLIYTRSMAHELFLIFNKMRKSK